MYKLKRFCGFSTNADYYGRWLSDGGGQFTSFTVKFVLYLMYTPCVSRYIQQLLNVIFLNWLSSGMSEPRETLCTYLHLKSVYCASTKINGSTNRRLTSIRDTKLAKLWKIIEFSQSKITICRQMIVVCSVALLILWPAVTNSVGNAYLNVIPDEGVE
jgi:hypothetical protein